jgi:PUA-domain protein
MQRHVLSEKESKEIAEMIKRRYAVEVNGEIEIGKEKKNRYYFIGRVMSFFSYEDEMVPTLCGVTKLKLQLPYVTVDEGAVKALVKGADLFVPGIKEYHCEVTPGSLVLVRTLQGVPVALLKVVEEAIESVKNGKGKFGVNIHHLKDEIWGLCNDEN